MVFGCDQLLRGFVHAGVVGHPPCRVDASPAHDEREFLLPHGNRSSAPAGIIIIDHFKRNLSSAPFSPISKLELYKTVFIGESEIPHTTYGIREGRLIPRKMKLTERIQVRKTPALSVLCHQVKNLYNLAMWYTRQDYFHLGNALSYYDLNFMCKETGAYHALPAQTAQQVLRLVAQNWKSYFRTRAEYNKVP